MTEHEYKNLMIGQKVVSKSGIEYVVAFLDFHNTPVLQQTRLNKSGRPYGTRIYMSDRNFKAERFSLIVSEPSEWVPVEWSIEDDVKNFPKIKTSKVLKNFLAR